jgi:putative ATP-dependent endonuclease of the OLD family
MEMPNLRKSFAKRMTKACGKFFCASGTKGIRLSESGSSLKSIFIIISLIRLVPVTSGNALNKTLLCVEEPENNLHPSLLRRLLNFLAVRRLSQGFVLFMTTHSPAAIDWSARRNDTQIVHVRHDGRNSKIKPISSYLDGRAVLDDLDVRASDILQANGIIWVEGPSDRLYIRSWLTASGADIIEGVHYTIMYYGGRLLSHLKLLPGEDGEELISLLSINRNAALVIESDRKLGTGGKKARMSINATKKRIIKEIEDIDGFVWITQGKEIENYIHPRLIKRISGVQIDEDDPYVDVPELLTKTRIKGDKISLAHAVASDVLGSDLDRLDLKVVLLKLIAEIRKWNNVS